MRLAKRQLRHVTCHWEPKKFFDSVISRPPCYLQKILMKQIQLIGEDIPLLDKNQMRQVIIASMCSSHFSH